MLGARTTWELSGSAAGRTRCKTTRSARAARRSAIKDRLAALYSTGLSTCGRSIGIGDRCFVHRARACLRHDNSANGRRRRRRGSLFRGAVSCMARGRGRGRRRSPGIGIRCCGCRNLDGGITDVSGDSRLGNNWRRSSGDGRGLDGCRGGSGYGCCLRLRRCGCMFGRSRLCVSRRGCGRWLGHDGDGRRDNGRGRTRRDGPNWSLGDHRTGRRTRSNGRRCMLRGDDWRRGPSLRDNFSRLRAGGRGGRRCSGHNGRRCFGWSLGGRCRGRSRGRMAPACLFLIFLFLGQYGLHHVAGLGDMGEINLGRNRLCSARRRAASVARRLRSALKMRANLLGLMVFNRTGVGLAFPQAELRQHVKYLTALDFHLSREIVDSNLTHPPLFKTCYPKPLVAHGYLVAMAASGTSIIV